MLIIKREPDNDRAEVSLEHPLPVTVENAAPVPTGARRYMTNLIIVPGLDTNAYGADDQVGTKMQIAVPKSGAIESVTLVDLGGQTAAAFDLLFFDQDFTAVANNAAFDLTDAERGRCVGKITVPAAGQTVFGSTETLGYVADANLMPFAAPLGVLFFVLTTQGTPTYAVGDLSLRFTIRRDD